MTALLGLSSSVSVGSRLRWPPVCQQGLQYKASCPAAAWRVMGAEATASECWREGVVSRAYLFKPGAWCLSFSLVAALPHEVACAGSVPSRGWAAAGPLFLLVLLCSISLLACLFRGGVCVRGTLLEPPTPRVPPPTFPEDWLVRRGALLHFVFNIATFLAVYSSLFMIEPLYLWSSSSPSDR